MPESSQDIWTIKKALDWTVGYLSHKGDSHPRLSAEWLLAQATGLSRIEVYAYFDKPLSAEERDTLRDGVRRRGLGEPLQYLSGSTGFRHITVCAEPGALIPRPETESLVELALERLQPQLETGAELKVLELGTGTGCIALSLASEHKGLKVCASDISPDALKVAHKNRALLGLEDRVEFIECDLVSGLDPKLHGSFQLLISNPPYIPSAEIPQLPLEVREFEPHLALDGGEDGLAIFRRIMKEATPFLAEGGILALELHETKLRDAAKGCSEYYECIEVHKDLAGRERFLTAVKRCSC